MKKLLTILLLLPTILIGQVFSSIGGSFPLTDIGGGWGKGAKLLKDIDLKAVMPYVTFGYQKNGWRFAASFIRLEGADSLAPAEGDSYFRYERKRYFINNIIEASVTREIDLPFINLLTGISVFHHDFRNSIQPALITGISLPLLKSGLLVNVEMLYRTTITDHLDNYIDEQYSKGLDNFFTVGLMITYKRKNNYLKCFLWKR